MSTENTQEPHRNGDFLRIPQVRRSSAIAYLVINCVIPGRTTFRASTVGLGTVIASWTDVEYHGWDWAVIITGILQFGLAWIIIGWAWSIWWGIRMFQDADAREKGVQEARQSHEPLDNSTVRISAEEQQGQAA